MRSSRTADPSQAASISNRDHLFEPIFRNRVVFPYHPAQPYATVGQFAIAQVIQADPEPYFPHPEGPAAGGPPPQPEPGSPPPPEAEPDSDPEPFGPDPAPHPLAGLWGAEGERFSDPEQSSESSGSDSEDSEWDSATDNFDAEEAWEEYVQAAWERHARHLEELREQADTPPGENRVIAALDQGEYDAYEPALFDGGQ